MRSVAIALDGVIRKPLDVEAQDMGGAMLFRALTAQFRVVVLGSDDYARDEHFMLVNGLTGHVKIEPYHPKDSDASPAFWDLERFANRLKRLRAEGFAFEFVVVPGPDLAMELLQEGFPVLVYAHPQFSPALDKRSVPWIELERQVEKNREAMAKAVQKQ